MNVKIMLSATGALVVAMVLSFSGAEAQTAAVTTHTAVPSGQPNRYVFFNQGQKLVRLDTSLGTFAFLNTIERVWNPLAIPLRDPRDGNENQQNLNLLATLSNDALRRLSDPALAYTYYRFISVNAGGVASTLPPGQAAPWVAGGGSPGERLLRLETSTGQFAIFDLQGGAFVRIQIPDKEPRGDINYGNVRALGGMKF